MLMLWYFQISGDQLAAMYEGFIADYPGKTCVLLT